MFGALTRLSYRRRWIVLTLAAAFLAFAATWGTGAFGVLSDGGFEDPDSESARAVAALEGQFGSSGPDLVVIYGSDSMTVDDPAFGADVTQTLAGLPGDAAEVTTSYFASSAPDLVSADRQSTYVPIRLADEDSVDAVEAFLDAPGLSEQFGGPAAVNRDINEQVGEDIARAEALSLPIVFVLLVVIFGGLVAAMLPLAIGGIAILGAFTAIRLITLVTDVSVFAINIVIFLGLGLAIDYGLFVVSRFREELSAGRDVESALRRTLQTAGRTVVVSGVTVAIAMSGLTLFPQNFLRSMGFGGIAAVLVAMVAALTVLPALLAVLGHRVDALSLHPALRRLRGHRADRVQPADRVGGWERIARSVMRRPVLYVVGIITVLLVLGTPFLRASFGGIDVRALPEAAESRVVSEALDSDFGAASDPGLTLAVRTDGAAGSQEAALTAYVERIEALPGVDRAVLTDIGGSVAQIDVVVAGDPLSDAGRAVVDEVRALPALPGSEVLVGGPGAELVDLLASIGATLPWMAGLVALASFVLLFLAFGSVLLPKRYDETGDNTEAVATGLQRTGGIITSAALLLIVVIEAFATSASRSSS